MIDTKLWLFNSFTINRIPDHWKCPECNIGILRLVKSNDFNSSLNVLCKFLRTHKDWEPSWDEYRFVAVLQCTNLRCGERVHLTGIGEVRDYGMNDRDLNEYGTGSTEILFKPLYFVPTLCLFQFPEKCPKEIVIEIKRAFSLFWSDVAASANKIRNSVELILNFQKVPQYPKNKRKIKLTLHSRIEKFKKLNEKVAKKLLAIKWISNEGSHYGKITQQEVLLAFQILEYSLENIYDTTRKELDKHIERINKSKEQKNYSKTN